MRCNFCGSEMTTGGCPKYDCPSKTRPVAPFRPSVWMPESVPAPSAPNSSKISNSSSATPDTEGERLWPVPSAWCRVDRDGDDEGMPLSREDVQRVMNDICGWFELGRKVVPPDQRLNNVGASLLLGAGCAVQRAVVEKLTRHATPSAEREWPIGCNTMREQVACIIRKEEANFSHLDRTLRVADAILAAGFSRRATPDTEGE